jgi:hypothetical protein
VANPPLTALARISKGSYTVLGPLPVCNMLLAYGMDVIFCHKKGGPKVAENRATDRHICYPKCNHRVTISWPMADAYARIAERILPIGQDIQSYLKISIKR